MLTLQCIYDWPDARFVVLFCLGTEAVQNGKRLLPFRGA